LQQRRLRVGRHVANLVDVQGTPVGQLDQAEPPVARLG
jgi:hypothetical protein